MRKRVIRYSEAFKQEVVRELETGVFENPAQASRRYGIKGEGTVKRWAGQYGRTGMVKPLIRVQKKEEVDEVKRLQKRVGQLESALADAHITNVLSESFLELACERLEEPMEEFKKKHAIKRWAKEKAKGRK
jgi:transposase-like protein|tara:strand:- start:981 stop:1376 length:396 start_codon:yes stop_codon:yes gene_type:complete